jgi:hypothetical protein
VTEFDIPRQFYIALAVENAMASMMTEATPAQ